MPVVKVGTQWFAVDGKDQPTGAPLDIELGYETYGDASAPPLLLCNGVSMQGVLFGAEFLEALAAAGPYYVIVYDSRDTGLSTKIEAAGDPAIAQVFAQKQLGMKQERKDGIPYFISYVPLCCITAKETSAASRPPPARPPVPPAPSSPWPELTAGVLVCMCFPARCSDLAADAVGLLDVLGVSAAHVVGFSTLGGATAQKLVIEHTARVSSLTLISAGTAEFGMPAPDPKAQKALEAVGESAAGSDPVATFVAAARILMSETNFDEARVAATAKLAHERAPPAAGGTKVCMSRQLCSQIAEEPRVKALQKAVSSMPKNAAACSRGQLSATLTTTEQITPPELTAKKYTAFVCEVRRGDELVNTLKDRYSSFLDLRDRLEANTIWSEEVKAI